MLALALFALDLVLGKNNCGRSIDSSVGGAGCGGRCPPEDEPESRGKEARRAFP